MWPITEKKQGREFKTLTHNLLAKLEKDSHLPLGTVRLSHLQSASGERYVIPFLLIQSSCALKKAVLAQCLATSRFNGLHHHFAIQIGPIGISPFRKNFSSSASFSISPFNLQANRLTGSFSFNFVSHFSYYSPFFRFFGLIHFITPHTPSTSSFGYKMSLDCVLCYGTCRHMR